MATSKPRTIISLDQDLHQLISDIAELREIPRSKVITEFLEECKPQLQVVSNALNAIKNNEKPDFQSILSQMLGDSFGNLSTPFKDIKND
jgi:transketolase C-terminal domain/subunit